MKNKFKFKMLDVYLDVVWDLKWCEVKALGFISAEKTGGVHRL